MFARCIFGSTLIKISSNAGLSLKNRHLINQMQILGENDSRIKKYSQRHIHDLKALYLLEKEYLRLMITGEAKFAKKINSNLSLTIDLKIFCSVLVYFN